MEFNASLAARLTAVYATPDVVEQRKQTLVALGLRSGEHVIDIGGAPGYLALDMAPHVGGDGRVVVVDVNKSMVEAARGISGDIPSIEIQAGDAQHLPFADGAFDVAVATQVFEFVADAAAAVAEAYRVLRPGGRIVVLDTDSESIVWASSDAELTTRLLAAWDRHHADPHLPRTLSRRLAEAGFAIDAVSVFPILNTAYDPTSLSYHLSKQMADHAVKTASASTSDAARWLDDFEERSRDGSYFFSLNRYVFAAHRPQDNEGR
jgi:SAM-dependent methyltransferase